MLRALNKRVGGKRVLGTAYVGYYGNQIPSSGTNGAGYLYNDLTLPTDAYKRVRGELQTWPSAGVFTAYEDSSFTFSGAPDGTYTATYQLFVDNVSTGSPATITLNVGSGGTTISGSVGNAVAAGLNATLTVAVGASVGNAVADGVQASITTGSTVNGLIGNAVASGSNAAITFNTTVFASVGNAIASAQYAHVTPGPKSSNFIITRRRRRN